LVERVKVNLAVLYERQTTLQALGLAPADEDPLEASVLLKQGFELSYGMRYAKQRVSDRVDNDVMLVDRDVSAVLTVKADFVRRDDFLDRISSVLPDFLSQKCSRQLLPRARWKGLLAAEPANVGELEQQLARLVEQALWSMVSDPALQAEQSQAPVGPPAEELELEGWMQEHDAKVKKKADKRKARRTKAPAALEPADAEGGQLAGPAKAQSDPDTSSTEAEEVADAARSSSSEEEEAGESMLVASEAGGCEDAAPSGVCVEAALEQLRDQPTELAANVEGLDELQDLDEPVASGDLGVEELQFRAPAREQPAKAPCFVQVGASSVFVRPPPGLEGARGAPDASDVAKRAPCYVAQACSAIGTHESGRSAVADDCTLEELKRAVALRLAGSDLFGRFCGA